MGGPSIALMINRVDTLARKIEYFFLVALVLGQFIIVKTPWIVLVANYL